MRAPARIALIALAASACRGERPAPLIAVPVPVLRGHADLDISSPDAPVPRVLGRSTPLGFCVDAPPETDTSQWEARLFGEAYVAPALRLDTTICFESRIPDQLRDGRHELCARLRDRFDGKEQALPCLPFRLEADDATFHDIEKGIPAALAARGEAAPRLDALADQARAHGDPALALRLKLIAAYTLRREGSAASRAEASERLHDEPAWIGSPASARWAGQLAYERAALALDARGALADGWALLRAAERSFRSCADKKWIAVVGKQAEVLSLAGALAEGEDRLRAALDACASAPCDPAMVRAARNTLAWLVISDADAEDSELASCERDLETLLAAKDAPADPLEHANLVLNLAFARQRLGRDPESELRLARELIGGAGSSRARELSGWADLAEARSASSRGRPSRAAAIGDRLGETGESPRLRAFGLGCAAAAYRKLGAIDRAEDRIARALALHAATGAARLGQDVPLGPGQRAEDVYAAARIEIERGRPEEAWSILRALDDEATAPSDTAAPSLAAGVATLVDLDRPASGPRRAQRESIRRDTLDRMQELARTGGAPAPRDAGDVTYRAFPLDDEIVVLRRLTNGRIVTYRRTPMPRSRLVASIRDVRDAIAREEPDDARWLALVAPLARALAPLPEDVGPLTTFATHGILQEVPLAALPVASKNGTRWLGEVTTVAWHPAGAGAGSAASDERARSGDAIYVIDPRQDLGLPIAPGTRVLRGDGATRDALRAALDHGRWLHVESHARYEPAFPELSSLVLADGPVTGPELAVWASGLELVNVSGCETGRAPVSADSGRFGLAGLLARRGVAWVVGARAALSNRLAIDFNREFYLGLAGGAPVPDAYRQALDRVRNRHPASRWGVLVLLHGKPERGQSEPPRTPYLAGGVP